MLMLLMYAELAFLIASPLIALNALLIIRGVKLRPKAHYES